MPKKKKEVPNTEGREVWSFSKLKRRYFTHEIDKEDRRFEMNGRRTCWVGFSFADEGEAQGDEILVLDDEDMP